jgi:hypothetical protein
MKNVVAHSLPRRQLGATTVAIAILITFILAAAVAAVLNMSGSAVIDATKNEEQVAAFFLAESGLERGIGLLKASTDPTARSTCETSIPGTSSLGRGTFTLAASATGCTGTPPTNCTSCTITSTGIILGITSRTIKSVVSLSAPGGGAIGCGGGGGASVNAAHCPGVSATDLHVDIEQNIQISDTDAPAVLISNIAYLRHPVGGASVDASGCVTIPGPSTCISTWSDESSHSTGDVVVGGRGAADKVADPGTYTFKQNLTDDTMYAAVGLKAGQSSGGSINIVGSYWDDAGNAGQSTHANSQTLNGKTNNGTLCNDNGKLAGETSTAVSGVTCTQIAAPPDPLDNHGTVQTSKGWCYGADTLIFGFSGRSANNSNGAISGVVFGNSPPATQVPNGFTQFPRPSGSVNSAIYSSMWYIHNPAYDTAPNSTVTSGAAATALAGASFTATLSNNSTSMVVSAAPTYGQLNIGDVITCASNPCKLGNGGSTSIVAPLPTGAYPRTYILEDQSTGNSSNNFNAASKSMYVSAVTTGTLSKDDGIFTFTAPTTVTFLGAVIDSGPTGGGTGVYILKTPKNFDSTTILTDGQTVTALGGGAYNGKAPTPGAALAIRWTGTGGGVGALAAGTTVLSPSTPTENSFQLSLRPTTPLYGVQLCGGICAYFDHSSGTSTTSFTATNTSTQQWAAGMTCLSNVNTDTIQGLIGNAPVVQATDWHEVIH